MSRFGDGGRARCSMGPKRSLERVFFSLKSPCLRGVSGTFLSSNITQVAVIQVWNDSYGSMGPRRHVGHLASVMGAMPSPRWIPNGGWRWSFLAEKSPCRRGVQWPLLANTATQVTVFSGCSSLSVSMGPRAYTKYLGQAVGAIVNAPWVRNGLWRGSFGQKPLCLRVFSGGLFASNVS